jgi:serine/threonine protein kinase
MASSSKIPLGGARLPREFGRYLLFDQIGRGGMAEIFLARQRTELGGHRLCVVKQIIPAFADHPQFAEMLIHEAKLAARLDHARIVQVFDLGRTNSELYIAMEYVEGLDLTELLRRCTKQKVPMPFEFALLVVAATLNALDYAHRRAGENGKPLGIVHRDVSPSNLLLSFDGEIKLCDFGIAHANEVVEAKKSGRRVADALQGKAGYMSPEHARGEPLDNRADVFAAGILFWELVAGHRMYRQEADGPTLLEQAKKAEIVPLPERGLPGATELARIIGKALAPNREDRYASAAAMLRDIEAYTVTHKLGASPLKLGAWLTENFGTEVVTQRRMRERAAEALERGPAVSITPITSPQAPEASLHARPGPAPPASLSAATLDVPNSSADLGFRSEEPLAPALASLPAVRPKLRPGWFAVLLVVLLLAVAAIFARGR